MAQPVHADAARSTAQSWRYRRARRGHAFRHGFVFTLGGGAYIAVCMFVGLAAANSQINPLFLLFGLFLGGLLVSGLLSTLTLAGLRVTRGLPISAMVGQALPVVYQVSNRKGRLASYSLHLREYRAPMDCSESYLPAVPRRSRRVQRALLLCRRRGLYRFAAITVYTRFPFSLFVHYHRYKDPDELLVLPAIGRLAHDAVSILSYAGALSNQPQARRGGDDEFFGLREYRHGDNPKRIHWRRSARLGTPLVREMSPPMPRRMMVLVSAALPEADARPDRDDELLEQSLSLAASLLHDALRQGFEAGLVSAQAEPVWFPASRGQHQRFDMMRTLALLSGQSATPLDKLPRQCLRHLAGAQCLWITRGLSREQIQQQMDALAALNLSVKPLRAEELDFTRLLRLPPPDDKLADPPDSAAH